MPSFAELGLPRPLVNALSRADVRTPFPIQAAAIPDALAGRDVLGRAATGSGKTLAFGLPVLTSLAGGRSAPKRPRALVLVPTRELAMQVTDAISPLAHTLNLSVRLVAGGLPIVKQIRSLERGVDIVVATPGRLVDLIERRSCDLRDVEITVLDEADHMADLGFLPVVRRLLDMTPKDGQRLLFSATLDGDVATLVKHYLTDPVRHEVAVAQASVDTMTHHLFRVPFEGKFDLVASIASREGRTICFVRTKHGAERMAKNLSQVGIPAGALHGGRTQAQRTRALEAFRSGSVPVLVATDVAARGIHVDDISLVLHVDPPQDGKDYVHRSGRTARAGESGTVIMLATPKDEKVARTVLAQAGVKPVQRDVSGGDDSIAAITGPLRPIVKRPTDRRSNEHRSNEHRSNEHRSNDHRSNEHRSTGQRHRPAGKRPGAAGTPPRHGARRRPAQPAHARPARSR